MGAPFDRWAWARYVRRPDNIPDGRVRLMLLTLFTYSEPDGSLIFSVPGIARVTGLGESTARRYLKIAQLAGLITRTRRGTKQTGPSHWCLTGPPTAPLGELLGKALRILHDPK